MSLASLKDVLKTAQKENYAVANFDVYNTELILGVIQAAERLKSPVILAYGGGFEGMSPLKYYGDVLQSVAKQASVPVVIHWDHAKTMDEIDAAISAGFTSVMIDASALPLEQNIEMTRKVVEKCHPLGIDVEAELGHVGDEGVYDISNYAYTQPEKAAEFVKATGIDALAIAIGNAHGVYTAKPKINYEVLDEVRHSVEIPLVLHGASGIPDDDIRKCVKKGITKVNIHTELLLAAMEAIENCVEDKKGYYDICNLSIDRIKDKAEEKINLFGSEGKGN